MANNATEITSRAILISKPRALPGTTSIRLIIQNANNRKYSKEILDNFAFLRRNKLSTIATTSSTAWVIKNIGGDKAAAIAISTASMFAAMKKSLLEKRFQIVE